MITKPDEIEVIDQPSDQLGRDRASQRPASSAPTECEPAPLAYRRPRRHDIPQSATWC